MFDFYKKMKMDFKLIALEGSNFVDFFKLDNLKLKEMGAKRMIVDEVPGFPCRVSLQDAELGEEIILFSFQYHKANSPYQATGPIFVRKIAKTAKLEINEIPRMFNHRLLSLRGYNSEGFMKEAIIIGGKNLREQIVQIFKNDNINYIHIHNAKPGCFNCKVIRV